MLTGIYNGRIEGVTFSIDINVIIACLQYDSLPFLSHSIKRYSVLADILY